MWLGLSKFKFNIIDITEVILLYTGYRYCIIHVHDVYMYYLITVVKLVICPQILQKVLEAALKANSVNHLIG